MTVNPVSNAGPNSIVTPQLPPNSNTNNVPEIVTITAACPVDVNITGTIHAPGLSSITYQWSLSDNKKNSKKMVATTAVATAKLDKNGDAKVWLWWKFPHSVNNWWFVLQQVDTTRSNNPVIASSRPSVPKNPMIDLTCTSHSNAQ